MTFWNATYEIARKEFMQHLRTKRLLIIGTLLVLSLVLMTLVVGVRFVGDLGGDQVDATASEHIVMLFYFSTFFVGGYFFIQLLAIVLTADAVCSEWSNRTIFLLLSKPVSRAAFVTGKFLGSLFTVSVTILVLFSLDYLVLNFLLDGGPSGEEVLGFFGALGVLILGAAAFTSLSLFFSTLTKSNVVSLLLTLGAWIIVLPLVGQIGFFSTIGDENFEGDFDDVRIDWSRYLNPGADMSVAGKVLVPDEGDRGLLEFLAFPPKHSGWALAALGGHTVGWFLLSLLVVQRRNFE